MKQGARIDPQGSNADIPIDEPPRGNYDTTQSIKTKKLPAYVEDVRYKDPQGTIDYLFARKEIYKAAAVKHYKRANEAEAKLKDTQKKLDRYKAKYKEERAMCKWWKYVSVTVVVGMVVLVTVIFFISQSNARPHPDTQKMPTSGKVQATPNNVLSSVNIYNGGTQGSGVVISKGDKYAAVLSAGHNFKGNIGGWVWLYYADGTFTKATLLAVDRKRDLAVLRVDKDTILAHTYLPDKIFQGKISGVGYTGGQGPNYRTLSYNRAYFNTDGKYMWDFSVTSGPFWDGDSGSGVFIDDALVGITSQRDAVVWTSNNTYHKKLYACSRDEIVKFLYENKTALAGCGAYNVRQTSTYGADEAPPLWKPSPNIPVYTEGRVDKMIADLRADMEEMKRDPRLKRPSEIPEDKKGPELKKPSEIK